MKNLNKIQGLFSVLFLLISFCAVHAAKCTNPSSVQVQKAGGVADLPRAKRKRLVEGYCRRYHMDKKVVVLIICFVRDNLLQYKNKPLPNDLSGQDLSGFDFTGCQFTYTNLTDTNLTNVVLAGTSCDYQKAFEENIKKNKVCAGIWYQNNLLRDLKSIASVYPKLNNDTDKATLLQVACGLARLPFYEGAAFYIKVHYWSCVLLQLKQKLGGAYGSQLFCSLAWSINDDAENYCWTTQYPQDKVCIVTRASHANFEKYLKDFNSGLIEYRCTSQKISGFLAYKEEIEMSIKGLQKAYFRLKDKKLAEEACRIACGLSRTYQCQQITFLYHYLLYQYRLVQLKNSVGVENEIHYSTPTRPVIMCWRRGEK